MQVYKKKKKKSKEREEEEEGEGRETHTCIKRTNNQVSFLSQDST